MFLLSEGGCSVVKILNSNIKRITFVYRLQLAALHFNENVNRTQAVTKQGTRRYDVVFPKYRKGGYIVKKILVNATYGKVWNDACEHS